MPVRTRIHEIITYQLMKRRFPVARTADQSANVSRFDKSTLAAIMNIDKQDRE